MQGIKSTYHQGEPSQVIIDSFKSRTLTESLHENNKASKQKALSITVTQQTD